MEISIPYIVVYIVLTIKELDLDYGNSLLLSNRGFELQILYFLYFSILFCSWLIFITYLWTTTYLSLLTSWTFVSCGWISISERVHNGFLVFLFGKYILVFYVNLQNKFFVSLFPGMRDGIQHSEASWMIRSLDPVFQS